MGRVGRHLFHVLKIIQCACSRFNLLYLGHGVLNNIPTTRVARKENWWVIVVTGSNREHRRYRFFIFSQSRGKSGNKLTC